MLAIALSCALHRLLHLPAIGEDYYQIRNAMALRGITYRNPMAALEYILMPLLMNSNNVAQDLSVAAMTICHPLR